MLTEDLDTCEEREQEYKEATQANEQKLLTLTADTRSLQVQTNKSSDYEQRLQRKVDVSDVSIRSLCLCVVRLCVCVCMCVCVCGWVCGCRCGCGHEYVVYYVVLGGGGWGSFCVHHTLK